MQLKNKIILITGSTTGIGEAIARLFVAEGAKVMLHGRNEKRAKALSQELGDNVSYHLADIGQPVQCDELVAATIKQFGSIHGVVNNAALMTRSNIEQSDATLFETIVGVNLRAPLLISRAAISYFRKQKIAGTILNIGSINAYCGQTDLLLYSLSKGGLMTLTRNLGDALGTENIRVNQINVGWTTSPNEIELKIREGLPPDWTEHVSPVFAPSGKLLTPEQVAHHALFWISDLSIPVNGTVCDVEQYPVIGRNKIAG